VDVDAQDAEMTGAAKKEQPPAKRKRRKAEQRRAEIAEAALRLMTTRGLRGTTVARIAEEVGLAPQSLYNHFKSQNEMLLATIDPIIAMSDDWLSMSTEPNVLKRLRMLGHSHASYLAEKLEGFVIPSYQVLAAPRETGLPEAFGRRHIEQLHKVARMIEEGQEQGTIRRDLDPLRAAWRLFVVAWTEDMAQLMGIPEFTTDGIANEIWEVLLQDMAAVPEGAACTER